MNGVEKLDDEVIRALSSMEINGNKARLNGQLSRSIYTRTNKALEAIGGKWISKEKAHVFGEDVDVSARIEEAIISGEVTDTKKAYDFFETPRKVALQVARAAQIEPGMKVLEPSAGKGALAIAALDVTYREPGQGVASRPIELDLYELQPELHAILSNDKRLADAQVTCRDFLTLPLNPVYDRVVMNPPFSGQKDIAHVLHAWAMLKPGGRLAAVMSSGVTFRANKATAAFRVMVHTQKGTITDLPDGSFEESGTGVRTVLVTMEKRIP